MIIDRRIDAGKAFDWGRTSEEYAKYRDVYPNEFYQRIADRGLCIDGQNVLDLGTGTGVLPRNMYRYGANWTGTDISPEQIEQAKRLSEDADMKIDFQTVPTEEIDFPKESYDVITACQCFWYFDHERVMPKLADILKPDGRLLILYMAWLPFEDKIAGKSEELVLKYSPNWTGAGETKHAIWIPNVTYEYFELEDHEEYDLKISFTKESWHGRMKASRGVGASLSEEELEKWDESQIIVMKNDKENKEECLSAVKKADYCVLVYRTYSNACLDPGTDDGFSSAVFDEIIALRHEEGMPVVVISCGLPYDAARFTDADAIALAYNSSPMKEIPNESGAGSAYAPNLAAALVSCFGGVKATGTLPVSVPEIDGNYQITDKILYEGGK